MEASSESAKVNHFRRKNKQFHIIIVKSRRKDHGLKEYSTQIRININYAKSLIIFRYLQRKRLTLYRQK